MRIVAVGRAMVPRNLFREFAGNASATDTQMIDSTHVKAHRSAAGGGEPQAGDRYAPSNQTPRPAAVASEMGHNRPPAPLKGAKLRPQV
jgi:hypothetical protein